MNKHSYYESEESLAAIDLLVGEYQLDGDELDLTDSGYWDLLDIIKSDRANAIAIGNHYVQAEKPPLRFFGISLLGEICNPVEEGEEQDAALIAESLLSIYERESSPLCQSALADALSKTNSSKAIPVLLELSASENEDIRWSSTVALGTAGDGTKYDSVAARLIELCQDSDEEVREWAIMWLGDYTDSAAARLAIIERLDDDYDEARTEAIYALADCGDTRGVSYLLDRLSGEKASSKDIEAAGIYALSELYEALDGWEDFGFLYEWARARCHPTESVRNSVDDEWLGEEWYLNVKHGVRRPLKFKEGEHL